MKTVNLAEMTWPEVKEALDLGYRRVIIPTASIEQHGYHLPLNTDMVLGEAGAEMVAKKIGKTLVAPSIRPGISPHHMAMPGTVTLRPETFSMILEDYITCYLAHGFQEIIFLASHGGNVAPTLKILETMAPAYPEARIISVADVPLPEELRELEKAQNLPVGTNGGHADERETSEMLSLVPDLVQMDKAECGYCEPLSDETRQRFFDEGVTFLSNVGCVGDPRPASAEAGIWYRETAADTLCERILTLLTR